MLHPELKFTIDKEKKNSLIFVDVILQKEGLRFLICVTGSQYSFGQYIRWNSISLKERKFGFQTGSRA